MLRNLARLSIERADYAGAESWARKTFTIFEKNGSKGWESFYSRGELGKSLAGQKKYADAEPLLLAGYEGLARNTIPVAEQSVVDQTGRWIVQLYLGCSRSLDIVQQFPIAHP